MVEAQQKSEEWSEVSSREEGREERGGPFGDRQTLSDYAKKVGVVR